MRLAVGAALAAAVVFAGCGGGDEGAGDLRWEGKPREYQPPNLPTDHVVQGVVKNDSLKQVTLKAKDVKVVDVDGRKLDSTVLFSRGYSHRLQPLDRRDEQEAPQVELLRGVRIELEPGKTAPLTVSWRGKGAESVDYGSGSLPLP